MEEGKSNAIKLSILMVSILVIFISISYAFLSQILTGTKKQVITAGNLELELKEGEVITLSNALPMYDEVSMIEKSFDFTLRNKTTQNADYVLKLKDVTESTNKLDTSIVKYGLTKDELITKGLLSNLTDNTLDTGTLTGNQIIDYSLRLWIDSSVEDEDLINGKSLSYRIEVSATLAEPNYVDVNLNGTDPVLSNNLVPVTIANDGVVTYADISNEWYNYTNKEWANAVVLEDSAKSYKEGDVINPADIESYFVWIPRYKYKIFNDGHYTALSEELNADAPQTIEIEFESKNTTPSNGTAKDEWLSHPAFQAFDTNGFWVGKFESGYKGAATVAEAQISTADSAKLVIKPNSYSWRNMNVGNMFKTSYEYIRDNESHMMKNTEWGAVAYLSHSQYGVNTEVYINNNNTYLTGCGGDTADASSNSSCLNAYGSKVDGVYNQSTTGNISGIFDMSGGAWEYVMGYNTGGTNVGGGSGIISLYSDFFDNHSWDKYYDKYANTLQTAYHNRILGDATGEMGPFAYYSNYNRSSWYKDQAYFVYSSSDPWFNRGGLYNYSSNAGIFYFHYTTGRGETGLSFRVVLSPQ